MTTRNLALLSDEELLAETKRVAEVERRAMADLLALLIEVERRRLLLSLGYPSLFAYCRQALGLSEQAAYSRITAARAVRRFPEMLPMLSAGELTLSSVNVLAPHLTEENHESLLEGAKARSTREVQTMVAHACPQPDVASSLRALPSHRAVLAPLAPKRFLLKVTIGDDAHRKLEQARDLLKHVIPNGDPALLIERAIDLLVKDAARTKLAATNRPRKVEAAREARGRRVPAAIKRAVWTRDAGRCAFVGSAGRCSATAFLEFHHVRPFADGGAMTVDNLELRCRPHNQHEARTYFGAELGIETSP